MDNRNKNYEKILRGCHWVFFIIYDIVTENWELVEMFIDTPATAKGKYVELNNCILKIEKSVKNANDIKEMEEFEITQNSEIFICYDKIIGEFRLSL